MVPDNTGVYIKDFMFGMNLKGYELLVYALVYSFSANGERQGYWGSCEKMAERLHTTRQRVNLVLSTLVEKGLVIRTDGILNKKKVTIYQANFDAIVTKNEPKVVIEKVTSCHQNNDDLSSKQCTIINNNITDNINSNSSEPNGSSEFANDESTKVSEDCDDTSSSSTISEESHTHSDNTKSNVVSSSTTEEKKVVPSSEKEFWGSLEDLESPKAEPKAEKKPRNYFKVPTIGEIAQYISENNYLVDAEGFYHYYRDRNWCAGRKKIDWKDKVRQWDLDRRAKGKNSGYKKQPASPYNLDIKNQSFSEENWK